jgi:NAD(P)-dependent dehydrogenase (short-subunit alcohol dehydrogenase family)
MTITHVLVTGAASGIGRAIALAAARQGWAVSAVDLDGEGAEAVARLAVEAGAPAAIGIQCDISDEDAVTRAFEQAEAELGTPTGIVANAGIELNAPLVDMPFEQWNRVLSVNLTGTFLTVREAVSRMLAKSLGGSIVCLSSPSAFVGFAGGGNSAYGASKGGISAFVRSAAIDLGRKGIRVNGLVPGATRTPLMVVGVPEHLHAATLAEIDAAAETQVPLGRLAEPEEIAAAATWLLDEGSSYVTGSNLVCDGGLLAKSANDF